jgi:restriction system protein
MARRKRSSPLEDFLELVAMLPWWAGVVLALIFYVLFHRWAQAVPVTAFQPGSVATTAVRSAGATLAGYGQYIVPALCLIGAGMSAWRRRARRMLVGNVAHAKSADALDGMSWREFEVLVGEAFRLQGFRVLETGGDGADGGVDLVLTKGSEKFLMQCKQWKAYKVGVEVVRELYGVMAARGATGGFVVTSGTFSGDAQEFAQGRNVKLVDGARLFGLIQQAGSPYPRHANLLQRTSLSRNGHPRHSPRARLAALRWSSVRRGMESTPGRPSGGVQRTRSAAPCAAQRSAKQRGDVREVEASSQRIPAESWTSHLHIAGRPSERRASCRSSLSGRSNCARVAAQVPRESRQQTGSRRGHRRERISSAQASSPP